MFEDALISPHDPSSKENLTPFTVNTSVIIWSSILILLSLISSTCLTNSSTTWYFSSSLQKGAPFCKDEEKYQVVDELVKQVEEIKDNKIKIDDQIITEVLTVNGVRFSFEDGSWGLIRASSNKPSLVIVTESPTSDNRKRKIFDFIDDLLQKTGKIGEYDQKI